jgi:hypothetical protein
LEFYRKARFPSIDYGQINEWKGMLGDVGEQGINDK